MRAFVREAVTDKEAVELRGMVCQRSFDFSHPTVRRVALLIQELSGERLLLSSPSYWRVESRPAGHPPHYDGCVSAEGELIDNHMGWCRYSGSVLLVHPSHFEGGVLRLSDPVEEHKDGAYRGLVAFSSGKDNQPQRHEVTPSREGEEGERRATLLLFLAREGGPH